MSVEFIVRLEDDGTMTWCGLSLDRVDHQAPDPDEHAKAVETIQAAMPGSTVVDDARHSQTPLSDSIRDAQTHQALAELWKQHKDVWTADHNKLAAQRKKEIGN
jgi:hypothetical protein